METNEIIALICLFLLSLIMTIAAHIAYIAEKRQKQRTIKTLLTLELIETKEYIKGYAAGQNINLEKEYKFFWQNLKRRKKDEPKKDI